MHAIGNTRQEDFCPSFIFFLQHLLQWKIETVKLKQTLYAHTIYNIYIIYIFFAQQVIIVQVKRITGVKS